jgi:DNA-binding NarL/FixJ family response regulator
MPSLILVNDHLIMRQGLRVLLENEPGFSVIGETATAAEAKIIIDSLKPDVVVLGNSIPGLYELIDYLCEYRPQSRTILLSEHDRGEVFLLHALAHGVAITLARTASIDELISAVYKVTEDSQVNRLIPENGIASSGAKLTMREKEVLQLVAEGHTNSTIAQRLSISQRTVESHRSNVMRKLGLHRQTALIRYALQYGIISLSKER